MFACYLEIIKMLFLGQRNLFWSMLQKQPWEVGLGHFKLSSILMCNPIFRGNFLRWTILRARRANKHLSIFLQKPKFKNTCICVYICTEDDYKKKSLKSSLFSQENHKDYTAALARSSCTLFSCTLWKQINQNQKPSHKTWKIHCSKIKWLNG